MYVHQPITITPTAEERNGNGHSGQLCNTDSSLTSFKAAVKTIHCHNELLTMWLDTMAATLNSFNFSTVMNITAPNLTSCGKESGLK